MNELLIYLVEKLSFLYNESKFKIIDSHAFPGYSFVVLRADNMRLKLMLHRGKLFLRFQSTNSRIEKYEDWYSFDMIRQFITGEIVDSSDMDDGKVKFVHDHINEIIEAFHPDHFEETKKKIHKFRRARSKRLFGWIENLDV